MILGIFIISESCFAQVTSGKVLAKNRSGYWTSLMLSSKTGIWFRVVSDVSAGTSAVVDIFPPSCANRTTFSFEYTYKAPLSSSTSQENLLMALRVDTRQLYSLQGSYQGSMGDQFGFVTLSATPLFGSLITDMKAGNILRGQLSWPNGTLIGSVAFPLAGFTISLNRANNACALYSHPRQRPSPSPFQSLPESHSPVAPNITRPPIGLERPA